MADEKVFNLENDEFSKPTLLMKTAISEAEVGDDVYREDPTVLKLEEILSKLLGKEAALFFPTDIMANLAAIMGHCWERGSEILIGETSSIFRSNQTGIAHLAGVYIRTLTMKSDGTFDTEEIISKIRSSNIHEPKTTLLCLENTYEMGGGCVLTPDYMNKIASLSKNFKFAIHMDGTRIMNAAVKLGMPVATLVESCDSVTICLSKGLCAPAGSVVVGNKCFIDRLLRCRKVLGGGMRQVGVLAAAGLIAINTMVERLKDDHDNAFKIGKAINDMRSKIFYVDLDSIQTNIVHINIKPEYLVAEKFVLELSKPMENLPAVRIGIVSSKVLCCMLYADIDSNDVKIIITKIQKVIEKIESSYTYT